MKKRIIHCIDKLYDGGAQTQLIHLSNNTCREKYEIFILCFDPLSSLEIREDINLIVIKKRRGLFLLISWYQIFKKLVLLKPDILQLWLPEIVTIPSAIAGFFSKKCFVLSCSRRIPIKKKSQLWYRDRLLYIAHVLANKMTTNFAMPLKYRCVFNKIFNSKRGEVIFNGLDISFFSNYRKHNKYSGGQLNLIYAGRLTYQKNVALLILAISELKNRGHNIKLKIFGQGKDEPTLKEIALANNVTEYINFKGFSSEWFKSIDDSHAFITASNLEGMPNVLFEAVAIGLPIIASNIKEISDHFKNGYDALLFNVNSVEAIVNKIESIINNPFLLEETYKKASKTIQKFSINTMVEKYELIYSVRK